MKGGISRVVACSAVGFVVKQHRHRLHHGRERHKLIFTEEQLANPTPHKKKSLALTTALGDLVVPLRGGPVQGRIAGGILVVQHSAAFSFEQFH